ncbi:hypothetical protein ABT352_22700 [Streptosporangium sp. NPDC000563]|uniref:hypothetical protein n=1 Tax=Streptosporangium sp. NPDC000563 TaxID=3154366 RepID=UPI0033314E51
MTVAAMTSNQRTIKCEDVRTALCHFDLMWRLYVRGQSNRGELDEARTIAITRVGHYMLDLANEIEGEDATTMRALAAQLQAQKSLSPYQLAAQAGLAERLARLT